MALKRLDIDPKELDRVPKITETLSACFNATGKKNFPRQQVMDLLDCSDHLAAIALLHHWRQITPHDLPRVPIEAVCLLAKVDPITILGELVVVARNVKGRESALKAILAHPKVVDATIKTARMVGPAGDGARKMMHESIGFLPTRQGQSITIMNGPTKKEDADEPDDDDAAFDEAFPRISANLERWGENRRELGDGR